MKRSFPTGVLALAIAGGFVGGIISQRLFQPSSVQAQTFRAPGVTNNELSASRFVLKDNRGVTWGEFKINGQKPEIILYDKDGQRAWMATTDHILPLKAIR